MPDDTDAAQQRARTHRAEELARLARARATAPAPEAGQDGAARGMSSAALSVGARRGPRMVWRVLVGVGVLALFAAAVATATQRRTPTVQSSPVLGLDLKAAGIWCTMGVAWAPTSQEVALAGYAYGCPFDTASWQTADTGAVVVYSVAEHRVVSRFQPDGLIARALQRPAAQAGGASASASSGATPPAILYTGVLWSPTGQNLALPFTVQPARSGDPITYGLLLVSPDGMHSRVLLHAVAPGGLTPSMIWDLSTGGLVPLAAGEQPLSAPPRLWESAALAPSALAYRWAVGGQLQGVDPLSASALLTGVPQVPIGDPDGGASFSIWQPGRAMWMSASLLPTNTHVYQPGAPVLSATFAAWSPDGRYVLAEADLWNWRLAGRGIAQPGAATLAALGLGAAPLVPVRDRALAHVLGLHESAQVAWRPDGTYLAAYNVDARLPGRVVIYRGATGAETTQLTPEHSTEGTLSDVSLLWSPDGKHLLVASDILGMLTIWGPGQLPR